MVEFNVHTAFRQSAYNRREILVPDLSDDLAAIYMQTSTSSSTGTPPTVDGTWADGGTSGYRQEPAVRMIHRGFTTTKVGESIVDAYSSVPNAGMVGLFSGVASGQFSSWKYSSRVYSASFNPVDVQAGDYTLGIILKNNLNPVHTDADHVVLIENHMFDSIARAYMSIVLRKEPWGQAGSVTPAVLHYSPWHAEKSMAISLAVTPSGPGGISFQIMHNSQLIPATPNLWSGGQLTPVALNLPE